MQLGLAGAVAADGVQVHAGLDQVRRQDGGAGLVGGDRRDDVGAAHRLAGACGAAHPQARCSLREVAHQLVGRGRVDVEGDDLLDAQMGVKGQRLELGLRAVADQRHAARVGPSQRTRRHQRGRGGAQRGGQRQLRQQHRPAGVDIGQHAEGHHGVEAAPGVGRVAVDVLEGVALAVGRRHQLDHADLGMAGHAGRLVELGPAHEVGRQRIGQIAEKGLEAAFGHQVGHRGHVDEAGHGGLPCRKDCGMTGILPVPAARKKPADRSKRSQNRAFRSPDCAT